MTRALRRKRKKATAHVTIQVPWKSTPGDLKAFKPSWCGPGQYIIAPAGAEEAVMHPVEAVVFGWKP